MGKLICPLKRYVFWVRCSLRRSGNLTTYAGKPGKGTLLCFQSSRGLGQCHRACRTQSAKDGEVATEELELMLKYMGCRLERHKVRAFAIVKVPLADYRAQLFAQLFFWGPFIFALHQQILAWFAGPSFGPARPRLHLRE